MFSERTGILREPNALARALGRRREVGARLLDLTVSNPTRVGLPYARDEILGALADPAALDYAPAPFGLGSARAAVASWWAESGIVISPERVVLTASTSEAYAHLFKLLCDAGDEVLAPEPSYPLFEHLARLEGVRLVPYRLAYDGAWHLDLASLERARSERTRAVVVVSPNNPTGSYLSRVELTRLAELGLPIIADEVFASYSLTPDRARPKSALEAEGALIFALGGLSKLAALPQLKLAWLGVGGPDALVAEALERLELILDTFLSVATPVQLALPRLLASRRVAAEALLERARGNHARLCAELSGSAASVLHLEGGWSACVRLPRVLSEETWVLSLLEERAVLVQPGWFYDFPDEPIVVVSLATPPDIFASGVAALREHVRARA
ncbi:MAG: pyridoxal phosphate-dependent aminotransferase [Sorangiineae bacterium]|nr:pyridoxal phosphate-dependent aminotransferase [Polyangiaceae bacterium]MEB2322247.1 pyridoxal phosphate-dependent aminotransferase [Sorangiineae bacterium]